MTKPSYEGHDPTWSRTRTSGRPKRKGPKNKGKMCSRSSLRNFCTLIRKKRAADQRNGTDLTICVTRTVELPSTQKIGEEKHKLLFMLALGLTPKIDKPKQHMPLVLIERLDPVVEAEAKARTRDIIFQIFEERKKESLQRRILDNFTNPTLGNSCDRRPSSPHTSSGGDVEVVDLVSSDDEEISSSNYEDSDEEVANISGASSRLHPIPQFPSFSSRPSTLQMKPILPSPPLEEQPKEKIMYSSRPWQRAQERQLLKPIINNQDNAIFRKWTPECIRSFINQSSSSSDTSVESSPRSQKSETTILSSLKMLPIPTTTTSAFAPSFKSKLTPGGSYKRPSSEDRPRAEYRNPLPDIIILD